MPFYNETGGMHMSMLFFDVDGTIVCEDGTIPKSTTEAIRALQKQGHRTFRGMAISVPAGRISFGRDSTFFVRDLSRLSVKRSLKWQRNAEAGFITNRPTVLRSTTGSISATARSMRRSSVLTGEGSLCALLPSRQSCAWKSSAFSTMKAAMKKPFWISSGHTAP